MTFVKVDTEQAKIIFHQLSIDDVGVDRSPIDRNKSGINIKNAKYPKMKTSLGI
jgi:hypothetical protein